MLGFAGYVDMNSIDLLCTLSCMAISRTMAILIGPHYSFGRHAERYGVLTNYLCKSYESKEEEETVLLLP